MGKSPGALKRLVVSSFGVLTRGRRAASNHAGSWCSVWCGRARILPMLPAASRATASSHPNRKTFRVIPCCMERFVCVRVRQDIYSTGRR